MSERASSRPRVLAILGMHRSGTSWLAGSLEQWGVALGEVSTSDPHNVRGNREHPALMSLHDAVLGDNDGSWKKPPRQRRWSAERSAALAEFIAGMDAQHALWGFKDPRALLLLEEWRRQLPHLARVGVFRHPLAVHRSLAARNQRFDERRSVKLWCTYNDALIAEHRRAPFPLLRFDVDASALDAQLRAAAIGLDLPDVAGTTFFESSLVHNTATESALPRSCKRRWEYLSEHVLRA